MAGSQYAAIKGGDFIIYKQPYELSVWSESMSADGIKEEFFGAIIGANDMTYLGRATAVKLTKEFKGTSTLTFQMPSKFYDSTRGEFVHNDLADLIKNESKIKLHFQDEWMEFYIKKISEAKQLKSIMYSYTCEDAFIDELSRTGYELEFDDSLNNSVAEVGDFMNEILDMSVWDYTPQHNTGDFTEYNEQQFYRIPLKQFGGTIWGYPIDLQVDRSMLLTEEETPNEYLEKELTAANKNWYAMSEEERRVFIDNLLTITNIFTKEERTVEFGDDLARERELFWDNYYKDNGAKLLDDDKKTYLTGDYIYVPITDLTMIMGAIYENAYSAVEEPAYYGSYEDGNARGYALQPSSQNPRDLVQFIFLDNKDEFHVDEGGVLCDNTYHYVIPIEDWSELLKEHMQGWKSCIYWEQAVPSTDEVTITTKYHVETDGDIGYTTDATPSSSTIDDFIWYPVYYSGYLDEGEATQARKLSVTNRTEYNKEADSFVTIYNNKSDEYIINESTTLYTDEDIETMVLGGGVGKTGDTEYRVCSKKDTRQILPTLAKNLVTNGTEITDTNGWEIKTQNINNEIIDGTGSYSVLASVNIKSTISTNSVNSLNTADIVADNYELDGQLLDESVSSYFLELMSPGREKCDDFSLEGTTEIGYILNFGFVSEDATLEKDKVYALRMTTGEMVTTGLTFYWRSDITTELPIVIVGKEGTKMSGDSYNYYTAHGEGYSTEALNEIKQEYEQTMLDYRALFQIFSATSVDSAVEKANAVLSGFGDMASEEIGWFYTLLERFPRSTDAMKDEKIALLDESLYYILFGTGGTTVSAFWKEENITQTTGVVVAQEQVNLQGLISIYDSHKATDPWNHFAQITNTQDVKYLKYYFLRQLKQYQLNLITYTSTAIVAEPLVLNTILNWQEQYIVIDQKFDTKVNVDLDKLLIGQGSLDIDGNYTVEGIDRGDSYISFEHIYDDGNLIYDVPRREINSTAVLKDTQYHVKENGKWHWEKNLPEEDVTYIEDNPFLLFKPKQTIEHPYIAIRTESDPMEVTFNNIEKTDYGYDEEDGIQLNFFNLQGGGLDNVPVKLVPMLTTTVDETILNDTDLDYDIQETLNWNWNAKTVPFTWDSDYLKSLNGCLVDKSSALNPVYASSFVVNTAKDHTIPYLLLVGEEEKMAGIIYLDKG